MTERHPGPILAAVVATLAVSADMVIYGAIVGLTLGGGSSSHRILFTSAVLLGLGFGASAVWVSRFVTDRAYGIGAIPVAIAMAAANVLYPFVGPPLINRTGSALVVAVALTWPAAFLAAMLPVRPGGRGKLEA